MSGYPMISPHSNNKEVIKKKIWYPMRYMVTTVLYQLYYTWQVIYIIYTSNYLWSFCIMYYIHSVYLATRSYHTNVWHYYRFLTLSPVTHGNKLVLMIRIPLIDLASGMNLYKIYNLPTYSHHIGKSLKYQLEGTNLAVTKDNKNATILTDTEFIRCILADRHFCHLNTGLYHVDTNQWCVTTMFFKDNDKISTYCCCVRQCVTSFYILMSLGTIAHEVYLLYFHTKPTQFLLISRFTVLHSLRWNYLYHALFITDPIIFIYLYLFTTQLYSNLELQFSTSLCLV